MPTIILFQPQIPSNTGNIVRTCHATGSQLILVTPLGFRTDDKSLRRAGLDYWEGVKVNIIDDLVGFLEATDSPFYFFSSHAEITYSDIAYPEDPILIFGSETSGLDPIFKERWPDHFVTLPMKKGSRCLNLSNSAAIAVYEVLRQHEFNFESTSKSSSR